MRLSAAAHADEGPRYTSGRNPAAEDTDTRFETESDAMELCDLAEVRAASPLGPPPPSPGSLRGRLRDRARVRLSARAQSQHGALAGGRGEGAGAGE